jgi:hypothetical protein
MGKWQLINILVGSPEWMWLFTRPKHRCENNINVDLKYIGRVDADCSLWFNALTSYGLL